MPRERGSRNKTPQERAAQLAAARVLIEQGTPTRQACAAVGITTSDYYTAWERADKHGFQAVYESLKNALARGMTIVHALAVQRLIDHLQSGERASVAELNMVIGTTYDKLANIFGQPSVITASAGDRRAAVEELYSHMAQLGLVARPSPPADQHEEPERPN